MSNKSDILRILGMKIRETRKSRHISQEKLAEQVDLHPTYISQLENGKANLTIGVLNAIADSLHTPIVDLLPDDEEQTELSDLITEIKNAYRIMPEEERESFSRSLRGIIYAYSKV